MSEGASQNKTAWKHIGLHGHSVGTFTCDDAGIVWHSALATNNDAGFSLKRSIPKAAISSAQFSVIGKSGFCRIQTVPNSKLHHELRFDGFPPGDHDTLKDIFRDKYEMELSKLIMSSAGTQFGLSKMGSKKLTFKHCILEDADEEGEVSAVLINTFQHGEMKCSHLPFFRNLKSEREKK
jgi:hypothetical protein